jgi:tetratricopeptide (TPR) repeat protein
MTRVIRSLAVLALFAAPLVAQDPVVAARMAKVGGAPNPKACKLPPSHFLVGSAATYLQTALKSAVSRDRALHDGQRTALQAITQSGQATNPAAWYYLGRIDLLLGDFAGADTALAKASAMKPDCAAEIDNARYDAWRALVGPGSAFQRAGKTDSAMYLYRAANSIYQKKPFTYFQMGEIFKAGGQTDSAIAYLEKAVTIASDTTETTPAIGKPK